MKTPTTRLGLGLAAVLLGVGAAGCASRQSQETTEATTAGAAMQQAGVMSQSNYVRLRELSHSVAKTHTISETDLQWTIGRLHEENNSVARARAFTILEDIRPMSAVQKTQIQPAIAPYLGSTDKMDQVGAKRVQKAIQANG